MLILTLFSSIHNNQCVRTYVEHNMQVNQLVVDCKGTLYNSQIVDNEESIDPYN